MTKSSRVRYGFETALGIDFMVGTLTEAEEQRARELLPEYQVLASCDYFNHEKHEATRKRDGLDFYKVAPY